MLMGKTEILGVGVDNVTMDGAIAAANGFFDGFGHTVVTPNPEMIMLAQRDGEFRRVLNEADLSVADGIGVVIASRILGKPLPERVAGFDFAQRLFDGGRSFYLFGAKPGIADTAARRLRARGVNVVGSWHGYFDDDTDIIKDINAKKPDVLLVCLGAPKQEKWIAANKDRLEVHILLGAGGTLDGLAGTVKRAPVFFQKTGTEWLYRAARQPSRFARLGVIPGFLLGVLQARGKGSC
jgi:N-acetylglucosaminyldiphosphoundecaprenol N-acetyl-beta-D-mannosaminyltransferase